MPHQNKLHITRRSIFATLNNGRHLPPHLFAACHMQLEGRAIRAADGSAGTVGCGRSRGFVYPCRSVWGWGPLGPSDAHANGRGRGGGVMRDLFPSAEIGIATPPNSLDWSLQRLFSTFGSSFRTGQCGHEEIHLSTTTTTIAYRANSVANQYVDPAATRGGALEVERL